MSSLSRLKLTLEVLEDRCLFAFGVGGYVTLDVGNYDGLSDVAIQTDGKILVAGGSRSGGTSTSVIARYTSSGTLDSSFGTGGLVKNTFKGGFSEVLLQPDGKIVAVGQSGSDFGLVRYNANGSLDNSFGNKGKVTTDFFGYEDGANAAFLQPDGKIIAVGNARYDNAGHTHYALARYQTNGTLDTSFGTGGKVVTTVGDSGSETAQAVVVQADGKIVVSGSVVWTTKSETPTWALLRYNANGTLDTSFGNGGLVEPDNWGGPARDVAVQADGKLVATGTASSYLGVVRLNTDGTLDASFDGDGKAVAPVTTGTDEGCSVVVQSDGKIVVVGVGRVFRFHADGSPDATFDGDGQTASGPGSHSAGALQTDGKIVTAGTVYLGNGKHDGIIERYTTDGSLDTGAALLAFGGAASGTVNTQVLNDAEVQPLLREALTRWRAAGADTSVLAGLRLRITNLGGAYLGFADDGTLWLDDDAAGYGWFVDSTPWDDREFLLPGDQGEQGRIDLLTVLLHEIGHLLGRDHTDEGVMQPTLAAGRRAGVVEGPVAAIDRLFSQSAGVLASAPPYWGDVLGLLSKRKD